MFVKTTPQQYRGILFYLSQLEGRASEYKRKGDLKTAKILERQIKSEKRKYGIK